MGEYQLELYEKATSDEIHQARLLLSRYKRHKAIIHELDQLDQPTPKQQRTLAEYKKKVSEVERAVRLILDEEIRKTIEMRYIQGLRRKMVDYYFRPLYPSTVGRRINEGIESVANSLKLFE